MVALWLWSCGEEEVIPEGIIPETQLVQLLADMEVAQAQVKYTMANQNNGLQANMHYYEEVLGNYQLNQEEFNRNLAYYSHQPGKMQEIYIRVIAILSEKQAKLDKK